MQNQATRRVVELAPYPIKPVDFIQSYGVDGFFRLKCDRNSLELPIYSLSLQPEKGVDCCPYSWQSTDGSTFVEVTPNSIVGQATMKDKEIVLYVVSLLADAHARKNPISRKVRFPVNDYLKLLKGSDLAVSADDRSRFRNALDRLASTFVRTNAHSGNVRLNEGFNLINYRFLRHESAPQNAPHFVEIELCSWIFNAINLKIPEILTLDCEYLLIKSPMQRRFYEIVRKHLGSQPKWEIRLSELLRKTGSKNKSISKFEFQMRKWATQFKEFRVVLRHGKVMFYDPEKISAADVSSWLRKP
jgi:plasmid replication initiation protein